MRIILTALFTLTFFGVQAPLAHADGRAFPPDDCSTSAPFMSFDNTLGANTKCKTGQFVLQSAIPNCAADQVVAFNGSTFYCKAETAKPPTCSADQFLSFNGAAYECKATGQPPVCASGQVLTYTGSGFTCVAKGASVPTCGGNQFLTYNGNSFQCAAVSTPSIPSCAAGQVLTATNGQLACVDNSPTSGTGAGGCTYYSVNDPNAYGDNGSLGRTFTTTELVVPAQTMSTLDGTVNVSMFGSVTTLQAVSGTIVQSGIVRESVNTASNGAAGSTASSDPISLPTYSQCIDGTWHPLPHVLNYPM